MSASLYWMIIRDNNSFLAKQRYINQPFSKEPNNMKGCHSFRFNGLVRDRTVGVVPAPDNKGVVLITKKNGKDNKPNSSLVKVTLKKHARKTMTSIGNIIKMGRYRKDLKKLALRRASALLKSQKPVVTRRRRRGGRGKTAATKSAATAARKKPE